MSESGAAETSASIRLRAVGHRYAQKGAAPAPVLSNITLDIKPGSIVSIVGPSGCGKSTLMSIIAGLIPPSEGELQRKPLRTGLVQQRPGLLAWRNLRENIRLPLELEPSTGEPDPVPELLELTGLSALADRYPHQLSGGMQSRVAMARSLVNRPELLLLDEPFGALDELTGQELIGGLSALLARSKPTVLMITHSLSHAVFLGDEVVVLAASPGRIVGVVSVAAPHPRDRTFLNSETYVNALTKVRETLWGAAS